eukprot:jgi/Mesvir1/2912/Mv13982-RA.1
MAIRYLFPMTAVIVLSATAAGAVVGGFVLASKFLSSWQQPPLRLGAYTAFKGGYFHPVVKANPAPSQTLPSLPSAPNTSDTTTELAALAPTTSQALAASTSPSADSSSGLAGANRTGALSTPGMTPSSTALPPSSTHPLTSTSSDAGASFCVLLIGFRYPSLWTAIRNFRTLSMLRGGLRALEDEALADPSSGLEHVERYGTPFRGLSIQYWRSHDHLDRWSRTNKGHQSRRVVFHKHMEHHGMYGMWHETYVVGSGTYEAVYVDMPPTGLGKVGHAQPVERGLRTGKERMAASKQLKPLS